MTWGDSYELIALAVVLTIDCVMAASSDSAN